MSTPVALFVTDPSFYNHATPFISILDQAGIGKLTKQALTYFSTPYYAQDPRDPTTRSVGWAAEYPSTLLIDQSIYPDFVSQFQSTTSTVETSLFQILDQILFNPSSTTDLETWLTTTDGVKDLYVAGSVLHSTTNVTDTLYTNKSQNSQQFTTIPYATFTIALPTGGSTVNYDITAYVDTATWLARYPNTQIVAISPPMSYSDLLTASLSTANGNRLAIASETQTLNYDAISAQIQSTLSSGYTQFRVSVNDSANAATVSVNFLILYKGPVPTQLELRQAVGNALTNSGVGTQAQWQTRIPDLFVTTQFYLIPQYSNETTASGTTIYPSVINTATLYGNVTKVLSNESTSYLQQNIELVVANYEKLLVASVLDASSAAASTNPPTFLGLFPSYQAWASTDTNFQYMSQSAQQFSLQFNTALAVAAGNETSTTLYPVTDRNLEYVAFVINGVEFCVITEACYTSIMKEID